MFLVRLGIGAAATGLKALILLGVRFVFPGDQILVYDFLSLAFRTELIANMAACPVIFFLMSLYKPLWAVRVRD
jgi:hypothetical protein